MELESERPRAKRKEMGGIGLGSLRITFGLTFSASHPYGLFYPVQTASRRSV